MSESAGVQEASRTVTMHWAFDLEESVLALSWMRGGEALAVLPSLGSLRILDGANGGEIARACGHEPGNSSLATSDMRAQVATGGQDGKVRWYCLERSGLSLGGEWSCEDSRSWCEHLAYSATGERLALGSGRQLVVLDPSGAEVFRFKAHESTLSGIAWRADGRGVASACYGGIRLFREREGQWQPYERLLWKGSLLCVAWSPNGRYVAAGSQESTVQFWRLPYAADSELRMRGYQNKVREISWDSGSRYLATGGGEVVTVWDVSGRGPAGTKPQELLGNRARIGALSFEKMGLRVASGDGAGRVCVWDLQKSSDPLFVWEVDAPVSALAWSPGGQLLAVGTDAGGVRLLKTRAA